MARIFGAVRTGGQVVNDCLGVRFGGFARGCFGGVRLGVGRREVDRGEERKGDRKGTGEELLGLLRLALWPAMTFPMLAIFGIGKVEIG